MVIDIGVGNRANDPGFTWRYIEECRFSFIRSMFRLMLPRPTAQKAEMIFIREHAIRKVLRGYAKDKHGNLILIGTMPVPHSKDKSSPRERKDKRHLVNEAQQSLRKKQWANLFHFEGASAQPASPDN
jgi:hypothetical protein